MEEYKHLLIAIGDLLKSEGLTKKADTFYLLSEGNKGLINFQKSRDSSKTIIKFTINLGIQSTFLAQKLKGEVSNKPAIEDCHWKKRIGFFLPQNQDYWWTIGDSNVSTEDLINEISTILKEIVLPYLNNHISDESLIQEWMSGISEGITELQRYVYLTTLLKLNNDERFTTVAKDLLSFSKGKPYEYAAKEHLKWMGFL